MKKNQDNKIKISVVGLGYVGLPLVNEFGKYFKTIGYDKNPKRIKELRNDIDINNETTLNNSKRKLLSFSYKIEDISFSDIYVITLPTPINLKNLPDTKIISDSLKLISKNIKKGAIIILESTVYPGFTEEICAPIIQKYSKLIFNKDFYLGYSPERINPGDKKHQLVNITKIISASNRSALSKIKYIYSKIIRAKLHIADSIKIAEAAKVIENTQRDLNIAFINELSLIFNKLNIDTFKVLEAASTKWNFMNFKPGLVGGHCIGVDPYYLTYKSIKSGINPKIILAGRKLNDQIYKSFADIILKKVSQKIKKLNNAKILILGMTFKENCNDIRNTKVIDLFNYIKKKVKVSHIYDPNVNKSSIRKLNLNLVKTPKNYYYDCVILAVPHKQFLQIQSKKLKKFINKNGIIFDLKGVLKKEKNIFTL